MKKALIVCFTVSLLVVAGTLPAQQPAAPAPSAQAATAPTATRTKAAPSAKVAIARMDIAGNVEHRLPTGVASTFPATTEKVYCYVELNNVAANTAITFVWTLGLNEMARVTQTATRTVAKYRTWSTKAIGGLKGDWKVDLVDASGTVLKTASFKIE